MNQISRVRPVWSAKAVLRAIWVAAGEPPEWIAARTDALLRQLGSAFDVEQWETWKGELWDGPPEALADIVRRWVMRDDATVEDPRGATLPEEGYSLFISGAGPRVRLDVHISAGAIAPGRRIPLHYLTIDLRELAFGAVTGGTADTICATVAQTWEPSMFALADSSVNRTARRGNWKIGVGYRLWICAEVGTIVELAEGLASSSLAGGTLVSAPDDWPAERVVEAMTQSPCSAMRGRRCPPILLPVSSGKCSTALPMPILPCMRRAKRARIPCC